MMNLPANCKNYGERQWNNVLVSLPDECEWVQEHYTLDMLDISKERKFCLFFQEKNNPDVDVISYTIKTPFIPANMKEGFKNAIDALKKHYKKREVKK
jgi:hypothetical protein